MRSLLTDGRLGPHRNLATNPGFETTSGTVEVWRNVALNPNAVAATGFSPNSGAVTTVTRNVPVPAAHPQGIATAAMSQNTGTPNPAALSMYNIDILSNTGPARTIGAWVYVDAAGYEASVAIGLSAPRTPIPANTWVWLTGAVPANTFGSAFILKTSGNASPTDKAYITGVTALIGATPQYAIWGSMTPADLDLTPAWTGPANNSASILTGVGVPTATTGNPAARVPISSTHWAASGSRSLRIFNKSIPSGSTPVGVYTFGAGDVGKTFTILATYRQEGVSGFTGGEDRRIMVTVTAALSPQAPDTPGIATPLRLVITPTAAGEVRLGGPGSITATGYWDDLTIVPGVYTGPPFSGDTPGCVWEGPRNASPSIGYPPLA